MQQQQQRWGSWEGPPTDLPLPDTTIFLPDLSTPHHHFSSPNIRLLSAPAPIIVTKFGLLNFITAFILGGLFFSTALAGVAAFVAVGKDNVNRLLKSFQIVLVKVWQVFCLGLGETRKVLRFDGKWKWREAWKVLKQVLLETRQAVNEGVDAIRMEAKLYSAAVGKPALIPLQYFIDRLFPFNIQAQMRQAMVDVLRDLDNPNVRRATLDQFSVGTKSPQLEAARAYELGSDAIAFDVEVKWESDLEAKISVLTKGINVKIPVTIKNVRFEGPVRIELSPLIDESPGFGAMLLSFPKSPKIGLELRVAGGEIFRVPWLKRDILTGIQEALEETLLWPKRVVIPSEMATGTRKLLTLKQLQELEETDPLRKAELAMMEKPWLAEMMQEQRTDPKSQLNVGLEEEESIQHQQEETNVNENHLEAVAAEKKWFRWMPQR